MRLRIITGCIIVFAIVLVAKLYDDQVIHRDYFQQLADRQYIRPAGQLFDRGTIYFTDKDGSLMAAATLKTGYTLAINPKLIQNADTVYQEINPIVPLDYQAFIAKATAPDDTYEEIADEIDVATGQKISALNIPGVNLYEDKWRYYPGETMAAQLLGFVGYNSDDNQYDGRYGLEKFYDNVLTRADEDVYVNFFAEIFSDIHNTFTNDGTLEGSIVTTIDPNIQAFLETELQAVQTKYSSKITGGLVIDPNTGSIYAMGAVPTFDPNNYADVSDISVYNNPLVKNVYELGSIMKTITMAIGIDTGVITPTTTYYDTASVTINGETIHNWDLQGHGEINMEKVLSDSLNVGAVYVEGKIGNQNFANYMYKFGFGEKTGIDLPNEATNLVSNLQSQEDVDYATAAFGQGIAVTPISMVRALSAVANGGTLITPHVVNQVQYDVGYTSTINPPQGPRVISAQTSKEVTQMLVGVYDTALNNDAGGTIEMPHYSIAAKTGTAQLVNTATGGYYDDRYLHSFFTYFPASKPRFLVFLYTDDPQGEELASHTLTIPAVDIVRFLINYYEISPDR